MGQCFPDSKTNLHKTAAMANCSETNQTTLFSPTFQCFGSLTGRWTCFCFSWFYQYINYVLMYIMRLIPHVQIVVKLAQLNCNFAGYLPFD